MQVQKMNLLNALSLILLGVWGYLETKAGTALIPAGFGVTLLFCHSGLKNQNKIVAHISVLLTLLILLALVGMRLPKSIESGGMGLVRVIIMISTSIIAMASFVKSFIDARKK
mgnify:CR=1 FL=1